MKALNLLLVVLVIIGASIIGACTGEISVTTDLAHEVGKTIEGTYTVSFDTVVVGHLILSDGQYTFMFQDDVDVSDDLSRFFFTQHPSGRFVIQYRGSVDRSTLLENLVDNEILLLVGFGMDEEDANSSISDRLSFQGKVFYIRVDKKEHALYFHSTVSEIQSWKVTKPWDEE